jgi:hypothetical protein
MQSGLAFMNLILHVPWMMLISTYLTNFSCMKRWLERLKNCVQMF